MVPPLFLSRSVDQRCDTVVRRVFSMLTEFQRLGVYWIVGVAVAILGEIVLICERGGGGAVALIGNLFCVSC